MLMSSAQPGSTLQSRLSAPVRVYVLIPKQLTTATVPSCAGQEVPFYLMATLLCH